MAAVAVDAQGAHSGAARALGPVAQPILRLEREVKSFFRAGQLGQRRNFHQGWEDLLIKGEGGFNHPGQAAGGARVAYYRFHRAQGAGELRGGDAVKIRQRFRFRRVFLRGSAAVGFEVADGGRVDLRLAVGLAQRGGIGLGGGRRFVNAASGGETEPLYDGVNPVAVADGVVQAL